MSLTFAQDRRLLIVTTLQTLAIVMLVAMLLITFKTTPHAIHEEVKALRVDVQASTSATRAVMSVNHERLQRIEEEMRLKAEQLKKAYEELKRLSPNFTFD